MSAMSSNTVTKSEWFPLALNITGKRVVVVGGGMVAERRCTSFLGYDCRIIIVAPAVTQVLQEYARNGRIENVASRFLPEHLDSAALVIAATDDSNVNAVVVSSAKARGILVCSADAFEQGDFIVPSVVRRGSLSISVSTDGKSPTLTSLVKNRIAGAFGSEWAQYVEIVGGLRARIQQFGSELERRAAVERIIRDPLVREHLLTGNAELARIRAEECLLLSSE